MSPTYHINYHSHLHTIDTAAHLHGTFAKPEGFTPNQHHEAVYEMARHPTQIQANNLRLCPEAYPVNWYVWSNIHSHFQTNHPANLHLRVERILMDCIHVGNNTWNHRDLTGMDLYAMFFHMCFPRTIRIRPNFAEDGLTMFTRMVPLTHSFNTENWSQHQLLPESR